MKYHLRKFTCYILVFMFILSNITFAYASPPESSISNDTKNEIAPASVTFPDIYDGPGGKPYFLIFEMAASNVNNLLVSAAGGKSFIPNNYIQNGAVSIHLLGTLTQSTGNSMYVGLAYLNYYGEFQHETGCEFEVYSNTYFDKKITITGTLDVSDTYYAYIKDVTAGTTTGSMGVYYAKY